MDGSWRYKRTGTRERPIYFLSPALREREGLPRKPGRGGVSSLVEKKPFPRTVVIPVTGKCKRACGREPGWEVPGERVLQLGFRGPDGAGARAGLEEWHRHWACETRGDGGKQSFWCAGRNSRSKVGPFTWAPTTFMRGRGPEQWRGDSNRRTALPSDLCCCPSPQGNGGGYHPGFPPNLETARDEPGN